MNHHIGYPTLEKFVKEIPYPTKSDVYAMLITEPGKPAEYGVQSDKLVITVQYPEDGYLHYCRIPVGNLTYIYGHQPFDKNPDERKAHAVQAFALVENWLMEQGLGLISATVAVPVDYRFLDGWADFLGYEKERGFFISLKPSS